MVLGVFLTNCFNNLYCSFISHLTMVEIIAKLGGDNDKGITFLPNSELSVLFSKVIAGMMQKLVHQLLSFQGCNKLDLLLNFS